MFALRCFYINNPAAEWAIGTPHQTNRVSRSFSQDDQSLLFLFRSLGTVFGAGLSPVGDTCGIKRTSDDMVSGTGQVLDSAAADQNDAVLLEVVSLARDIARYFNAVGKTYSGDLSEGGIRLLRRSCLDCCADTALLRSGLVNGLFS